jgi:hypothetical protein
LISIFKIEKFFYGNDNCPPLAGEAVPLKKISTWGGQKKMNRITELTRVRRKGR